MPHFLLQLPLPTYPPFSLLITSYSFPFWDWVLLVNSHWGLAKCASNPHSIPMAMNVGRKKAGFFCKMNPAKEAVLFLLTDWPIMTNIWIHLTRHIFFISKDFLPETLISSYSTELNLQYLKSDLKWHMTCDASAQVRQIKPVHTPLKVCKCVLKVKTWWPTLGSANPLNKPSDNLISPF